MLWYATNITEDKEEQYKYNLGLSEYLASFWNSEAVQKVRSQREMAEDDRFVTDQDFEEQLLNRTFADADDIVKSIKGKYKNTNLPGNSDERGRTIKSPKDMSGLFNIAKKR